TDRTRLHEDELAFLHLDLFGHSDDGRGLLDGLLDLYELAWMTYGLMTGGLVLAAIPLLGNAATVMFTFYPPLQAHWAFYVGLTLVVAGTWLVTLPLVLTYRTCRAQHPGERTPLAAFMTLITFAMWSIASLGLAAEMLLMLIPWSLGWQRGIDLVLARTLCWVTGVPCVYLLLFRAYVSVY